MWQSVFFHSWKNENDCCFSWRKIWHSFISMWALSSSPMTCKYTMIREQRQSCKTFRTKVLQSHLSGADCDVTLLQIVPLTLISSGANTARFFPDKFFPLHPWEIYCSVFTSHSVLLTPHLQQSKCYHCGKWAGMHAHIGESSQVEILSQTAHGPSKAQ